MKTDPVAVVWSAALLGTVTRAGRDPDDLLEPLEAIVGIVEGSSKVKRFFNMPTIKPAAKRKVLDRALGSSVDLLLANYLRLLIDRSRISWLRLIAEQFRQDCHKHHGRLEAVVTSAAALSDEDRERMQQVLARREGKKIVLETRVDPSLLGGVVVRIGDRVWDHSASRELNRLGARLTRARIPIEAGYGD